MRICAGFQAIENTLIAPFVLWHAPCIYQLQHQRKDRNANIRTVSERTRVKKFSRRQTEENLEREEIRADHEQHINTTAIRQTDPTNRSSTA
jgi:hypothetical protein